MNHKRLMCLLLAVASQGFGWVPRRIPTDAIVIVSVAGKDFEMVPDRKEISRLIDKLSDERARIIVFDILFDKRTADDTRLINSLKRSKARVVFPGIFRNDVLRKPHRNFERHVAAGTIYIAKDEKRTVGKFEPYGHPSGVSIAYMSALLYLGYEPSRIQSEPYIVEITPDETYVLVFDDYRLDISGDKFLEMLHLGEGNLFRVITSEDVLSGNFEKGSFEDKIVIVEFISEMLPSRYKTEAGEFSRAEIIGRQIYSIWQLIR